MGRGRPPEPRTGRGAKAHEGPQADVELVVAMRGGDPGSLERYFERFHRVLLEYARRAGLLGECGEEFVSEILENVTLEMLDPRMPVPRNPRLYLIRAFRNKLLNLKRGRKRRELREQTLAGGSPGADIGHAPGDPHLATGCSEAMVRESRGPGWERPALPAVLEQLAARLGGAIGEDERTLLVAVAENVPQREIAEWLGVSHGVVRKRLERLRGRLAEIATDYVGTSSPDDAKELQRFFRRCGVRIGAGAQVMDDVHASAGDVARGQSGRDDDEA